MSQKSSEEVLDELLQLPQPPPARTSRRKKAINDQAKEITAPDVLQEMKDKELADAVTKKKREDNKLERERKAKERLEEKERKKLEREKKALERTKEKERKTREKRPEKQKHSKPIRRATSPTVGLDSLFSQLDTEDEGQCSSCGMCFKDEQGDERFWVCCDKCDGWYCFACHNFSTKDTLPDEYYCSKCM